MDFEVFNSSVLYDENTGILSWRKNGKQAFSTLKNTGHLHGWFKGKTYLSHRVAWLLYYGEWPNEDIDHINGVRHDNRIENLRDVSRSANMMNASMYSRNTSGKSGVSYCKSTSMWRVQTKVNGDWFRKSFINFDDACKFRDDLFMGKGFSKRHGL
jgi:hypothetical protein